MTRRDRPRVLISTGNVTFIITRLMLLLGQFNYGKRGFLDLTHTRLFTFGSLRRLLEQAGFDVHEVRGIPAPFPLAIGDGPLSRLLLTANQLLIRLLKGLFSYQIFVVAEPRPSLDTLLQTAVEHSSTRTETTVAS